MKKSKNIIFHKTAKTITSKYFQHLRYKMAVWQIKKLSSNSSRSFIKLMLRKSTQKRAPHCRKRGWLTVVNLVTPEWTQLIIWIAFK